MLETVAALKKEGHEVVEFTPLTREFPTLFSIFYLREGQGHDADESPE